MKSIFIGVLISALLGCNYVQPPITEQTQDGVTPQLPTTTPSTGTQITEAEAKSIALKHANLSESDVTFLKIELDYDDGILEYDVEFYSETKEYDYEINALTGEIRSFDYETETKRPITTTPSTGTQITEAEAKSIALKHANLSESDVTFLKIELDYDDGILEYDVEFYSGTKEYDYEINALTGEIRSFDYETETKRPTTTTPSTGTQITEAEAKSIALKHANLSESDVTKLKIELDYDDGILVYDVEFDVDRVEYSYEINANTGVILEYEIDTD